MFNSVNRVFYKNNPFQIEMFTNIIYVYTSTLSFIYLRIFYVRIYIIFLLD